MTKSAKRKRKMRDQSDFELLSHQVCLGAKQLEKKKQIILPINIEEISYTGGELVGALAKKEKLKNILPHILSQKTQKTIFLLFLNPAANHTDERTKKHHGGHLI
jgi:hypothetical protein